MFFGGIGENGWPSGRILFFGGVQRNFFFGGGKMVGNASWLVVEPTPLKSMLVKLDHLPN